MSKTTKAGTSGTKKAAFTVKPVSAATAAAIILEELSRDYGDVCNYLDAVRFVQSGDIYFAYLSIIQHNESFISGGAETSPRRVWAFAQAEAAVKKIVDPLYDRWAPTKAKWFSSEERCRKMNRKFISMLKRKNTGEKPVPYARELYRLYEAIHYVLGDTPPIDEICESAYYGPGSTVSIRGREVHYARKVEANECVPLAVDLAARSLAYDKAAWEHYGMDPTYSHLDSAREGFIRIARERLLESTVRTDRLMFIHKNMTSLRSIGAQPTVSGMLQLGVHCVVQPLLAHIGIDLADQGKNRKMAGLGSRHWDDEDPICTLDKTDASNLISKGLIHFFFPPAWAALLNRIRTPGYEAPPEIGGGQHTYHMYAGMGNGTTFCVETLLFWAGTFASSEFASIEDYVKSAEYAVYGDDVILRRSHAKRYMQLMQYLGLRFNMGKTFLEGRFRESCGADFYDGVPVRPASIDSESGFLSMTDLIGIHNTLADNRTFPLSGACARLRSLWKKSVYPVIPTDPAGNLGFRPFDLGYYDIIRDKSGSAILSPNWQRPRTYVLSVKPQFADLGELDPWTQIAVSLLRAKQSVSPATTWSLPVRNLTTIKVVPERDLERKDLGQMLANCLHHLAVRKEQPWFSESRGLA